MIPVIPYRYLQKPHSLPGKWFRLSSGKQNLSLCLLFFIFASYPLLHFQEQMQHLAKLEAEITGEQEKLQHQKRIYQSLQQKTAGVILTPEIAGRLAPLNQRIQHILMLNHLQQTHSQWAFLNAPVLNLQIKGAFTDFHTFSTALLSEYPRLELTGLQIKKSENDDEPGLVLCTLALQLNL